MKVQDEYQSITDFQAAARPLLEAGGFQTEVVVSESTGPPIYAVLCSLSRHEEISCTAGIFGRHLASGSIHIISVNTLHTCRPSLKSLLLNARPVMPLSENFPQEREAVSSVTSGRSATQPDVSGRELTHCSNPIQDSRSSAATPRRAVDVDESAFGTDQASNSPLNTSKRKRLIVESDSEPDSDWDIPLRKTIRHPSVVVHPLQPLFDARRDPTETTSVLPAPSEEASVIGAVQKGQIFKTFGECDTAVRTWHDQRWKGHALWQGRDCSDRDRPYAVWRCRTRCSSQCLFRVTAKQETEKGVPSTNVHFTVIHAALSHNAACQERVLNPGMVRARSRYEKVGAKHTPVEAENCPIHVTKELKEYNEEFASFLSWYKSSWPHHRLWTTKRSTGKWFWQCAGAQSAKCRFVVRMKHTDENTVVTFMNLKHSSACNARASQPGGYHQSLPRRSKASASHNDSDHEADYELKSDSKEEENELDSPSSDLNSSSSSSMDELDGQDDSTHASSPSVELIGKGNSSLMDTSQAMDADETMDSLQETFDAYACESPFEGSLDASPEPLTAGSTSFSQLAGADVRKTSSSASSEASTSSPFAAIGFPRDTVLLFGSYGIQDFGDLAALGVQSAHIPAVVSFMKGQRSAGLTIKEERMEALANFIRALRSNEWQIAVNAQPGTFVTY